MEGWIKLYRKFTKWEWYNISEMVHLFIHLLLNANSEDGEWRGVKIKRGQILTGLHSLNKDTKISYQTLRTCLKRLEKTKEINMKSTNKYSIITICNYESYQVKQQATNKQTNKQLTSNQQTTNNKQEYKEEKNKGEITYTEFYDSEIIKSEQNENYLKLVKALHGENNLGIPLKTVLSMPVQLSYDQFSKLWHLREKYKFSIIQTLEKMEDWGNPKKRKTVYGTFLTFIKNENKEIVLQ